MVPYGNIDTAQAANRVPLQVYGQTSNPINLKCEAENGTAMLHLGIVLVVVGLGANCLIGEPAKESNNIICLPKHKLILIANGPDVKYAKYANEERKYQLVRAVTNVTLKPGDQIQHPLPKEFEYESQLALSPRPDTLHWLQPGIHSIENN